MKKHMKPHEQLYLLVSQSNVLCRKIAERELFRFGITPAEYSLLRVLENTPNVTASVVRIRLSATAPSVAQLVKSLQAKRLIVRKDDVTDTRKQPMRLSADGRILVRNARKALNAGIAKIIPDQTLLQSLIIRLTALNSSLRPHGK